MSNIDDKLVSIYSSHAVYLSRLGAQFGSNAIPYLQRIENQTYAILNSFRANAAITSEVRREVQRQINEITRTELQAYTTQYKLDNKEFGANEVDFNANVLTSALTNYQAAIPTTQAITSLVNSTPMSLGTGSYTTYNRYVTGYHKQYTSKIDDIIRAGFLNGTTMGEVTSAIKDQLPGAIEQSKRGAKQMARTATNYYANKAMEATVNVNDEVVKGYEFIATLDSRTSRQCSSLDGNKYKSTDNKRPRFPLHPNERSVYGYWIDDRYKYDNEDSKRNSNFTDVDGVRTPKKVSSAKTYYDELRGMKAVDQDSLLGSPTLGKAFRKMNKNGDIDIFRKQLIDSSYQPISISELKKKDNELGRILKAQIKGG